MNELINITQVNPTDFTYQDYSSQDETLIPSFLISSSFDQNIDNVELFLLDFSNNILYADYQYTNFSLLNGELIINPEQDINQLVGEDGLYYLVYNFLSNKLNSSVLSPYYIKEISSDRTEIRLDSNVISNLDIISGANTFISERNLTNYELDFYLDFGQNQLIIANNILLDNSTPDDPTILIKLYEALPQQFGLKDECWVNIKVTETLAYEATYEVIVEFKETIIPLRGPNTNLDINNQINNSTDYQSQSSLKTSTSSSYQYQLNSFLAERGLDINIDYSDFSNFVNFSSAQTRIENFYYKLQLIEEYEYSGSLSGVTPLNTFASSSQNIWDIKVQDIIDNFDHYEYYLYYESGSNTWPKTNPNSGPPYFNVSSNSVLGLAWLNPKLAEAEFYDDNNDNYLYNTIPTYLSQDPQNEPLQLFVEMLGQSFDDTWVYLKDVTNKWDADNRINYGVSKDIVADVIRDLGVKIYQNNFGVANLYSAFLGYDPSGSFNFPYDATGSLPVPALSGLEYVTNYVTASSGTLPLDDVNKRIYKRIYHNLPYLLKTKGTLTGLRTLITSYGIPDTILRINEFGGKDKLNVTDWDLWQNQFNYAFTTSGSGFVNIPWGELNSDPTIWSKSIQFRFKTFGLPTSSIPYSQSLYDVSNKWAVVLEYDGSGYASGSYSGSIIDPEYQYANLKLIDIAEDISSSVYLPFFDGDWWSVMVNLNSDGGLTLYSANKLYYDGDDGANIGFIASSSTAVVDTAAMWELELPSYLGGSGSFSFGGKTYNPFSGSFQEFRYYSEALDVEMFKDYTMNPLSTEGNSVNSTPDTLWFRTSLGAELDTTTTESIHPKITGSWAVTQSFYSTDTSTYSFTGSYTFEPNTEFIFLDQPIAGIRNAISNKIKDEALVLPSGNTLSAFKSIQQTSPLSGSYTANVNYLEVAFSPQNEINDDIMDQIGFLNLGDYIGDPRQRFNQDTSYPDLDRLRNAYFEKYKNNYDINDYIRLIKYFDNSLFKMIKDFVPVRTGLAAGVVVKQHLLERNKYPTPEVSWISPEFSGSIDTAFIEGGSGGSTPLVTISTGYFLVLNTSLVSYITQNSSDLSFGGSLEITVSNQNGNEVLLRVSQSGGALNSVLVWSPTTENPFFNPGDIINIPTSLIGGTTNVVITLTEAMIGAGELVNFVDTTSQAWYGNNVTPYGLMPFTQSDAVEFFNGEFSGSEFVVTNGELNPANPVKQVETTPLLYYSTGSATLTNPSPGQFFWRAAQYPVGGVISPDGPAGLKYMYINETDANGVNILTALQNLNPGDSMTFTIVFDQTIS
jgi:hypothetical protein